MYFTKPLRNDALQEIRKIPYLEQNKSKYKTVLYLETVLKLKALGYVFNTRLKDWWDYYFGKRKIKRIEPKGLTSPLFNYQIEGISTINYYKGRCLLADEQGIGKTAQVIGWLHHTQAYPSLIICPASLKLNWEEEIKTWLHTNPSVEIISGTTTDRKITADIVIINYDILTTKQNGTQKIRPDLLDRKWETVVCDEAHYINNPESIRGNAVATLANKVKHLILVTATPSQNKPKQLFHLLHMINPIIFSSKYRFLNRYCDRKKTLYGWDDNGSSNEKELNYILSRTMMIRRLKRDVFKELDRKIRQVIPLQINNRIEYNQIVNNYKIQKDTDIFVKINMLKQLAVEGKMPQVYDFIDMMLTKHDKLVIFAEHKDVINVLEERYNDICVKIDGSVNSPTKRDEAKEKFQRCKNCGVKKEYHDRENSACEQYIPDLDTRIFLGSSAAKEGLTLTASYVVIFVELWWSPKDHDQAEDRCYGRAGDLHGCNCYYLIAKDTIEEYIAGIFDLKNKMLDKVLDGRNLDKSEMLTELIKE